MITKTGSLIGKSRMDWFYQLDSDLLNYLLRSADVGGAGVARSQCFLG